MSGKSKKLPASHTPAAGPLSISDAEWAIMEILWESAPRTSGELCVDLKKTHRWKRGTVMTHLSRLIAKGIIVTDGDARPRNYAPTVPRESCVTQETRGFLNRLFDGALLPLVAHCLEHQKIPSQELSDLRTLLNRKKRK
jgi:BlaI family penicillinase repressor